MEYNTQWSIYTKGLENEEWQDNMTNDINNVNTRLKTNKFK